MYSAALRLALYNEADLLIDPISGFLKDRYHQKNQMDHFSIRALYAPRSLRWDRGFRRAKGWLLKTRSRCLSYKDRPVILEDQGEKKKSIFDERLLKLKLERPVTYMWGYFQSPLYFEDIREELINEFQLRQPLNLRTERVAREIRSKKCAVMVHARQLRGAPNIAAADSLKDETQLGFHYYDRAIMEIAKHTQNPHFFCFGDCPGWLKDHWEYDYPVTFVSHNNGWDGAVQDFYLMKLCRHFIVGNSTFSWWPAWLSSAEGKVVVVPQNRPSLMWSNNRDVIPHGWMAK